MNGIYSETWELGHQRDCEKPLNSEVVLFLRSFSTFLITLGTEVAVLIILEQLFPYFGVILKTSFTVHGNVDPGANEQRCLLLKCKKNIYANES